jgi:NAD(P)-dependent dehydrogenase (short-subunit alcohol dehydrogenase family)
MGQLDGKTAVVLGASKHGNMGQIIAERFVSEGARVIVSGRDREELERFAGGNAAMSAVTCDITSKAELARLAAAAEKHFGGVNIAVNAVGLAKGGRFTEFSEEDLRQTMEVQFKGPFQFLQAMVAAMERGGGGSIIQISSATATVMTSDYQAYMGTKAGIDHVVRAVANEYGGKGIRVNSISPGFTESPMTAAYFQIPGLVDAFAACYPLGRVGTSQDIAAAAVWLATDECFMTGQNLQVNGGLTLRANPTPQQRQYYMEKAQGKTPS